MVYCAHVRRLRGRAWRADDRGTLSAEPLELKRCEEAFAVSPLPVWVADVDTLRMLWVNEPALRMWRAESREELYGRDLLTGAPDMVMTRLRHVIARVLKGEVVCEEWVFYPGGEPNPVMLHMRKISLADGSEAMLNQAAPIEAVMPAPVLRTRVVAVL